MAALSSLARGCAAVFALRRLFSFAIAAVIVLAGLPGLRRAAVATGWNVFAGGHLFFDWGPPPRNVSASVQPLSAYIVFTLSCVLHCCRYMSGRHKPPSSTFRQMCRCVVRAYVDVPCVFPCRGVRHSPPPRGAGFQPWLCHCATVYSKAASAADAVVRHNRECEPVPGVADVFDPRTTPPSGAGLVERRCRRCDDGIVLSPLTVCHVRGHAMHGCQVPVPSAAPTGPAIAMYRGRRVRVRVVASGYIPPPAPAHVALAAPVPRIVKSPAPRPVVAEATVSPSAQVWRDRPLQDVSYGPPTARLTPTHTLATTSAASLPARALSDMHYHCFACRHLLLC